MIKCNLDDIRKEVEHHLLEVFNGSFSKIEREPTTSYEHSYGVVGPKLWNTLQRLISPVTPECPQRETSPLKSPASIFQDFGIKTLVTYKKSFKYVYIQILTTTISVLHVNS